MTRRRILVVDVGGTHVKLLATGERKPRMFDSGPHMTAAAMARTALPLVKDWNWDAVSIGYPAPVVHGHPLREPYNLGGGWVRFDYPRAFGAPVKLVNDAVMQALGSYRGGRMLFLGLGTGLGSTMIVDGAVQPMELAHMPYRKGKTYEDYLGAAGLRHLGHKKWQKHVLAITREMQDALQADYVVLGGGNAKQVREWPQGVVRGNNAYAFRGGRRLWDPKYELTARTLAGAGR